MNFREFKTKFQKVPVIEYPNKIPIHPTVSVCVPTYNHEYYIKECLESILNQKTDFEFEILLGDDESDDLTKEICLDYAKKFPNKIRFFSHKRANNIKVGETSTGVFNALYSLYSANGKYIAYCDGDDYWGDVNKLQLQVDFLEQNTEHILNYHEVKYLDDKTNRILDKESSDKDLSAEDLKQVNIQPLLISVCFRNIIREYPIGITKIINSDNFLISLLGHYGKGKFFSNIKPATYRMHTQSIWSSISIEKQFISKINTFKIISSYYKEKNSLTLGIFFKKKALNYNKMLIFYYFNNSKLKASIISLYRFVIYKFL